MREARHRSPKPPRCERREAGVPRYGTQGASQAPGLPRHVQAHGCLASTRRLSALRHPSIGGAKRKFQNPGAKNAPRERERLCEMANEMGCVKWGYEHACDPRYCALAPLAGRGQLDGRHTKDWVRGTRRKAAPHASICPSPHPLPAPLRHSASLRAFTPVFDGLWTRVNALTAGRGRRRRSYGGLARPAKRSEGGKELFEK